MFRNRKRKRSKSAPCLVREKNTPSPDYGPSTFCVEAEASRSVREGALPLGRAALAGNENAALIRGDQSSGWDGCRSFEPLPIAHRQARRSWDRRRRCCRWGWDGLGWEWGRRAGEAQVGSSMEVIMDVVGPWRKAA